MSNPYEASSGGDPHTLNKPLPAAQLPGMVGHIRIVAILMMIQGVLELLMAVYYVCFGIFFGEAFSQAVIENQQGGNPPPREFVTTMMTVTVFVLGACGLIPGVLHCYAGYRNFLFSNRTLGMIALAGGIVSLGTIYCCPTSMALLIYGCIVYQNQQVGKAFALTAEGYPPDAILTTFSRYRYEQEMNC